MIEIAKFHPVEVQDSFDSVQDTFDEAQIQGHKKDSRPGTFHISRQVLRFGLVGSLNTVVDVLILNSLLWLFPTTSTPTLLTYNALAFSLGAVNSFLLNKYWTFKQKQKTTLKELTRFMLTTLCGIGWSTCVLWLASTFLHSAGMSTTLWANASKGIAIASSALLSYLVMRLWVFVRAPHTTEAHPLSQVDAEPRSGQMPIAEGNSSSPGFEDIQPITHSLSVVLPVYNEEYAITTTIEAVLSTLQTRVPDLEIIPVNDGSSDRTGAILATLAGATPQIRVVTHEQNQGYGAALADGFAAATKELTFFMDSDGQFDIEDIFRLLAFIDDYDAVIGYRMQRQDTWMRKLNAWGWKGLIGVLLRVHVRDIDCAFKLLRTDFLHCYAPETRGAMINAEMLYKLNCAGYSYREVGVSHLPRRGGRATGANLRVIARAFREIFIFAWKHRHETTAIRIPYAKVSR